jgi:hypothetical protein
MESSLPDGWMMIDKLVNLWLGAWTDVAATQSVVGFSQEKMFLGRGTQLAESCMKLGWGLPRLSFPNLQPTGGSRCTQKLCSPGPIEPCWSGTGSSVLKGSPGGTGYEQINPVYSTNGLAEIYTCGGGGHHTINKKSIADYLLTLLYNSARSNARRFLFIYLWFFPLYLLP